MDLNHFESSANLPELELGILPNSGKIVFLRMASRIEMEVFKKMVEIGISGCQDVHKILKDNVMTRQLKIIASRTLDE